MAPVLVQQISTTTGAPMSADLLSVVVAINKNTLALNQHIDDQDKHQALVALAELRLATSVLKALLVDV
jgi:hypothetical protein